jgi:hypothetical protein
MVVIQEHQDGSQEWLCPVCGRHFIMQWPPNYKRVVLEPGDENAVHTGGSSGVMMGSADLEEKGLAEPESAEELYDPESLSDPYLAPYERFLKTINL